MISKDQAQHRPFGMSPVAATTPLTIAICSNRPELAACAARVAQESITEHDRVLVVLDADHATGLEFTDKLPADVQLILNQQQRGLSYSRNQALSLCESSQIVFIDDDVLMNVEAVQKIREAFHDGWDIVGVRILGPEGVDRLPWFISTGQLHYLGIHKEGLASTWGACMGVSMRAVRSSGLRFREDLGRRDGTLLSAEDTTFLTSLKANGAREIFLNTASVRHDVLRSRFRLPQMLRRAFWQGRSERARGQAWAGFWKEVRRNSARECGLVRRICLTGLYSSCVLAGILTETCSRIRPRRTRQEPSRV